MRDVLDVKLFTNYKTLQTIKLILHSMQVNAEIYWVYH